MHIYIGVDRYDAGTTNKLFFCLFFLRLSFLYNFVYQTGTPARGQCRGVYIYTHTHIHIYIYVYVYMCVYICLYI